MRREVRLTCVKLGQVAAVRLTANDAGEQPTRRTDMSVATNVGDVTHAVPRRRARRTVLSTHLAGAARLAAIPMGASPINRDAMGRAGMKSRPSADC
jgi:hypothetical protein